MEELLIYVLLSTVYQIGVTTIILGFFFWFQVENGVDKSLQFMDTLKNPIILTPSAKHNSTKLENFYE